MRLDKSKDTRRRARKLTKRVSVKTTTKVIPDKRKKPEKHAQPSYVLAFMYDA
jgi:hypothetical protein